MTLPNPNSNMVLNVAIKVIDTASPWYGATYDFVITVPDQFPIHAPRAECKTMVRFTFVPFVLPFALYPCLPLSSTLF